MALALSDRRNFYYHLKVFASPFAHHFQIFSNLNIIIALNAAIAQLMGLPGGVGGAASTSAALRSVGGDDDGSGGGGAGGYQATGARVADVLAEMKAELRALGKRKPADVAAFFAAKTSLYQRIFQLAMRRAGDAFLARRNKSAYDTLASHLGDLSSRAEVLVCVCFFFFFFFFFFVTRGFLSYCLGLFHTFSSI